MSFHDVQLPTAISYGATGGPRYGTTIQTTASGHEYRIARTAAGRRQYQFAKELLEAADWTALIAFAAARRGHLHGFRFKDWSDYTSNATDGRTAPTTLDQVIATGDGTTVAFQLLKSYDLSGPNPEVRTITLPVTGTVVAAVDGVTTAVTVTNPGGVITFSSAPANGTVITAGFEFDVPVRFDLPNEWVQIELGEGLLGQWSRVGCLEILNEVETPELWYPGGSSGTVAISADYTVTFAVELWTFNATGSRNVFLPPPDRLPGGNRILTIHNLAASSGTIQVRDDAGAAVGSSFSAGTTKRLLLSRSGSSATWILA